MKVAIQGIAGCFHQQAAIDIIKSDTKIEWLECNDFDQVFQSVEDGVADLGICALENSLYGSINPVYRLLQRSNLQIVAEHYMRIEHYLISIQGSDIKSIDTVMTQLEAFAQVENWLNANLPDAVRVQHFDTADSIKIASNTTAGNVAAVGPKLASELYSGQILAGPINDEVHNITRFIVLSKTAPKLTGSDKCSLIIQVDDKKGSLFQVLQVFNDLDISLTKLDSHPIPGDKMHYNFYLDFYSNLQQSSVAMKKLIDLGCNVKLLGNYTSGQTDSA
jgi:prephenate dehydratase